MSVGIKELSLDEVLGLQAATPERGKYLRVATEFDASVSVGQDVTGLFDTEKTQADSIFQGFKKAIKDAGDDLSDIAVVNKDGAILLYHRVRLAAAVAAQNGSEPSDD